MLLKLKEQSGASVAGAVGFRRRVHKCSGASLESSLALTLSETAGFRREF